MTNENTARSVPAEPTVRVPATLVEALDPEWLTGALANLSGGRKVTSVEQVELLRTVATKVRFAVTFDGMEGKQSFCLKGLLDADETTARGGATCVHEGDFYSKIAPHLSVQVPHCVAAIADREAQQGVIIMRDLVVAGGRFCSALEPFSADDAAASLEQITRLHAGSNLLKTAPWIKPRAASLARMPFLTEAILQELLDGPRGDNLSPTVRSAARLFAAMRAFADKDEARPQFLVHGDAHAGNIFRTVQGAGLIDWQILQRSGWAVDVAYHTCAVLPVEVAEREERNLLRHYLGLMRGSGQILPDEEQAWRQYREAVVYGYFLWAITRRVDPAITVQFVDRLGRAVMRHDSYALLGVA